MVLVGEKKYACETCIKGHRSTSCKHTDRPLFEIKKKGRPVTQCEHCRELRKTKQVHVKCVCEVKDEREGPLPPVKKGGKKVPASATFPSGLPPALGASVALQPPSDGSDSEYGSETSAKVCICKAEGPCHCWTPRNSRHRRPSKSSRKSDKDTSPIGDQPYQPASLVATAHLGGNRPVLPRPNANSNRSSPPRSTHSPTGTSHSNRAQLYFSPYGRAYGRTHGSDVVSEVPVNVQSQQLPPVSQISMPPDYANRDDTFLNDWLSTIQQPTPLPPPQPSILCDCGPNCACPGCVVHRGQSALAQGFASCENPQTCNACLECSVLSLAQNPIMDEWFRGQISTPDDFPGESPTNTTMTSQPNGQNLFTSLSQQQAHASEMRYDPQTWQSYALWTNLQGQVGGPSPPEDCGCGQDCTCANCSGHPVSMDNGKTLTFAVSGERNACCDGGKKSPQPSSLGNAQAGPSRVHSNGNGTVMPQLDLQEAELDLRGVYEWSTSNGNSSTSPTDAPRVSLSRASSRSSGSSSQHSHYSSSAGSVPQRATAPPQEAKALKSCCASLASMNTSKPARSPIPPYIPPSAGTVPERTYQFDTGIGSARMF